MKLIDILTSAEIPLPNDLKWEDELNWVPVTTKQAYSLTGALIIDAGTRQKGRPVTLKADTLEMAWVSRQTVELLRSWCSPADRRMRLVLEYPDDTRQIIVAFRHHEVPVEATPVKGFPGHSQTDWFHVTLRLMEVL